MSRFRKETNDLLKALQNADDDSWKEFYFYTYDHVKMIAYKYVYNKSEWKDVVQQTYLNILEHITSFDDTKDGYNWIYKIAKNAAIDCNNVSKNAVNLDDVQESLFVHIEHYLPDNSGIFHALTFLTFEEQKLIELKYVEELTYSEIAKLYKSKTTTIYMRINKIIAKIKKILKNN